MIWIEKYNPKTAVILGSGLGVLEDEYIKKEGFNS